MKKFYTFFGVISWYALLIVGSGYISYQGGYDAAISEQQIESAKAKKAKEEKLSFPTLTAGAKAFLEHTADMPLEEYFATQITLSGSDIFTLCFYEYINRTRLNLELPQFAPDGQIRTYSASRKSP